MITPFSKGWNLMIFWRVPLDKGWTLKGKWKVDGLHVNQHRILQMSLDEPKHYVRNKIMNKLRNNYIVQFLHILFIIYIIKFLITLLALLFPS